MTKRKVATAEELRDAPARASTFFSERFGTDRRSMGRRQALDFVRHGWGAAAHATVAELGAAFDAAVESGEVVAAGSVTFRVAYSMAPGASAGGSSMGTRPISADMFTAQSVRAWAERAYYRFAASDVDRGL